VRVVEGDKFDFVDCKRGIQVVVLDSNACLCILFLLLTYPLPMLIFLLLLMHFFLVVLSMYIVVPFRRRKVRGSKGKTSRATVNRMQS